MVHAIILLESTTDNKYQTARWYFKWTDALCRRLVMWDSGTWVEFLKWEVFTTILPSPIPMPTNLQLTIESSCHILLLCLPWWLSTNLDIIHRCSMEAKGLFTLRNPWPPLSINGARGCLEWTDYSAYWKNIQFIRRSSNELDRGVFFTKLPHDKE